MAIVNRPEAACTLQPPLHIASARRALATALLILLWLATPGQLNAQAPETPCACWIDVKTGKPVGTVPAGAISTETRTDPNFSDVKLSDLTLGLDADGVHAHNPKTGQTYVRIPCPPPESTTATPKAMSVRVTVPPSSTTTAPQPHILDAPSAAEPGNVVSVHLNGTDPRNATFWLDERKISASGISGDGATLTLPTDAALGPHQLVLRSGAQSNSLTIHLVKLTADPLAATEPGVRQTVSVHVEGLSPSDMGTMYFKTADPAQFVSGKPIESAPVLDGVATTQIVGIHQGRAVIQFKLVVTPKAK